MSVEGVLYYRNVYLKSDKWQNVRLEALVREKGRCQICGDESISNDAHHIWYPESIWETTPDHLVILCRDCHDFLHVMLPDCKTSDEESGRAQWIKFSTAIAYWRSRKLHLFTDIELFNPEQLIGGGPKMLRAQLVKLTQEVASIKLQLQTQGIGSSDTSHERELELVLGAVKKWAKSHKQSADCGKFPVEQSES